MWSIDLAVTGNEQQLGGILERYLGKGCGEEYVIREGKVAFPFSDGHV